jgi:hypothetical protein
MASWRRVAPALVGLVLSVATLPQPSRGGFAISRLTGRPGAEVTISGTLPGDAAEDVSVRWDGKELITCEPAPASCPGDPAPRGFRITFAVPDGAAPRGHKVWLCIRDCDPITEAWSFVVEQDPPPGIETVTPGRTAAGGSVEVSGFTGPCQDVRVVLGTPSQVEQPVTGGQGGAFLATVTVPKGTIPGTYGLELHATCGQVAVVGDKDVLEVVNQAPQPAGDTATTGPGQAVDVPVGDNDVDPDGDDGYQTLVAPLSGAANGEVQPQPDGTIRYLPRAGFAGQDRFRYRSCDVVDPSGRLDCGTATVTVTVQVAATTTGATATSQGGGGPGPATSGQLGGVTSTGPATTGPGSGTTAPVPTIVPGPAAGTADDRRQRLLVLVVVLVTLLLAALSATVWRAERTRRQRAWTRQHVRGQPHPGPARSAVDVDERAAPPPELRLQPHPDDGVQHLEEATP